MKLDPRLLAVLVCPKCKGEVEETPAGDGLVCRTCNLVYPVKDGIPVMLKEEAAPLERES